MSKQPAFFMDSWELFQQEHPERFTRKKRGSGEKGTSRSAKVYYCSTCGLCDTCGLLSWKDLEKEKSVF